MPDSQEIKRQLAEKDAEIARLKAEIEKLKALIEELRRGGKRQAAPFSKGPPKTDPKPPGRKAGENYGAKTTRAVPPRIDEVHAAPLPEECPFCHQRHTLRFEKNETQYQTEIPRKPLYRQFNVAVGHCSHCGHRVQGRHPLQTSDALHAAQSQLGADAQALAVSLNKEAGLSHGKVCRVFETVFGIKLSRGGSAQAMLRAAQRCGAAYKEIQLVVRRSPWVVPDETGWKVGGILHWLHVFAVERAALYLIRRGRGWEAGCEALGEKYAGYMIRDGWKPYDRFKQATHQQCNAHLLRRCKELAETARGAAVIFPRKIKVLLQAGLALRDRRDAGALAGAALKAQTTRLENRLEFLCGYKTDARNERLAKFLYNHKGEVFTYLRHTGIDATNWRAEQETRPAVVNRKVWGGSRTEAGAEAQGILMSVMRTALLAGKNCVDFLAATLRAPPGRAPRLLPLQI